jgi:hypothetical protein
MGVDILNLNDTVLGTHAQTPNIKPQIQTSDPNARNHHRHGPPKLQEAKSYQTIKLVISPAHRHSSPQVMIKRNSRRLLSRPCTRSSPINHIAILKLQRLKIRHEILIIHGTMQFIHERHSRRMKAVQMARGLTILFSRRIWRRRIRQHQRKALLIGPLDALQHHSEDEWAVGILGVRVGWGGRGEDLHAVAETVEEHS